MAAGDLFSGEPAGETFIEPQIIPPSHGHEIAKPLVGDLMSDDPVDMFALGLATGCGVKKEGVFFVDDASPIFHSASAGVGQGDLVELGKWILCAEVFGEVFEDFLGDFEGVAASSFFSGGGVNAQLDSCGLVFDLFPIASEKGEQVGRHRWGFFKEDGLFS